MTDEELFATAIRILDEPGHPTVTPYNPGTHWCNGMLARIAKHAEYHRNNTVGRPMPRVIVGHVNNPQFNAAAFSHPNAAHDELFIAVNGGTSIVVEQLFARFLSEPEILTWIGDASVETPGPRFKVTANAQTLVEQFAAAGVNPLDRQPKDPRRKEAALLLSVLAMEYIGQHELCHIQGGHLTYVPRLAVRPLFREAYNTVTSKVAMQLQALELEADCVSACRTLHAAFVFCDDKQGSPSKIIRDIDTALFFAEFAMYCVWRLFGDTLPNLLDWKLLDHPPSRMRQHLISNMLLQVFKGRAGENGHDRYGKQFVRTGFEAERGFAKIQGCDPQMEGAMQVLSRDSIKHMEELRAVWRSMEADLARGSHWGKEEVGHGAK